MIKTSDQFRGKLVDFCLLVLVRYMGGFLQLTASSSQISSSFWVVFVVAAHLNRRDFLNRTGATQAD